MSPANFEEKAQHLSGGDHPEPEALIGQNPKDIELSRDCWEFFSAIRPCGYAALYTHWWADQAKWLQEKMRERAPGVVGDWYRAKVGGHTLTFTMSDSAINDMQPRIREFGAFAFALKMLGAYQIYFRHIARLAIQTIPGKVQAFAQRNNIDDFQKRYSREGDRAIDSLCVLKTGRGVAFFQDLFGYRPDPAFGVSLDFSFELRNVTVHNAGVVDQKLAAAADRCGPYLRSNKAIVIGDHIEWYLDLTMQLHNLFTSYLPYADNAVRSILVLPSERRQPYWYWEHNKH